MYRSIVVLAEGPHAAQVVEHAAGLATAFGASLHLVATYKPRALRVPQMVAAPPEGTDPGSATESELDAMAAPIRHSGRNVTVHAVPATSQQALLDVSRSAEADLIIAAGDLARGHALRGGGIGALVEGAGASLLLLRTD